nr:tubulin-like doman-containing protein [uncultured Rhodopila sp.]
MGTLALGFGGTGTHILTYLKELAIYKHGEKPNHLTFIEFDTIARERWKPGQSVEIAGTAGFREEIAQGRENIHLDPETEYVALEEGHPGLLRLVESEMSRGGNRDNYPHLKDWLHTDALSQLPAAHLNISTGAAQQRQIGRYAMFANFDKVQNAISRGLRGLKSTVKSDNVAVWIAGSSAGGTGAGCMIDAAAIVRMICQQLDLRPTIVGLIVLPEVYAEVGSSYKTEGGISKARAYSFLRELQRLQEINFQGVKMPARDRFTTNTIPATASSEFTYGDGGKRVFIPQRLFDFLAYLGENCESKSARISFFNAVASAVDTFLDENVGPQMMEELINTDFPLCFGGARLSIPLTTYKEIFVWEQVRDYLRSIGVPKEDGSIDAQRRSVGFHSGSPLDRETEARKLVDSMLKLFEELRELAARERDQFPLYIEKNLGPETIINRWYQFESKPELSEDDTVHTVPLAYCNPVYFLGKQSDSISAHDINVKTFQENRKAKGPKESQPESLARFAKELRAATTRYLNASGGEGTFEKGRRFVRQSVTETLLQKVDAQVREAIDGFTVIGIPVLADGTELAQRGGSVRPPPATEGTQMTRLLAQLQILGGTEGPLGNLEALLGNCNEGLALKRGDVEHRYNSAIVTLSETSPSRMPLLTWVEDPQLFARQECADYVTWHQKRHLLLDMRDIIAAVRQRYTAWRDALQEVMLSIVLERGDRVPKLSSIRSDHLDRLINRLLRLSNDKRSLISLAPAGRQEIWMQGYADKLRQIGTREDRDETLAWQWVQRSKWVAGLDKTGRPTFSLAIQRNGQYEQVPDIRRIDQFLFDAFRPVIDTKLRNVDIFDYLKFEVDEHGAEARNIAVRLNDSAALLLDDQKAGGVRWVYRQPVGAYNQNFADALKGQLGEVNIATGNTTASSIINYTDPTSLTLLKAARLDYSDIEDIKTCQREYTALLGSNIQVNDRELQRALIYHPFRGESEAWFIERQVARRTRNITSADSLVPPRIVRLLDRPDYFRAFVLCLATGAVERDDDTTAWVWHAPGRSVKLSKPGEDLIRAAVVFVLQRIEDEPRSLFPIELASALASAKAAAADPTGTHKRGVEGMSYAQQVQAFIRDENLDRFLDTSFPIGHATDDDYQKAHHARDREGLKMAMQFYGDPANTADLSNRMLS